MSKLVRDAAMRTAKQNYVTEDYMVQAIGQEPAVMGEHATKAVMSGVQEFVDGDPVCLVDDSGELFIEATNEGGHRYTLIGLRGILDWLDTEAGNAAKLKCKTGAGRHG